LLEPHFVKRLNTFQATHKGPYGKIHSVWRREGKKIIYKHTIPANSSTTLKLTGAENWSNNVIVYQKAKSNSTDYITSLPAGKYEYIIQ
jgi:alpha-L-rhamnosidase